MNLLTSLTIRGWKSIRDSGEIELRPLNVLIGPNGSGKSNLITFFKMLNYMTADPMGSLQFYVARYGSAKSLLHYGPAVTPQLEAKLRFEADSGANDYEMRLFHAAGDTLIFADERCRFSRRGLPPNQRWMEFGAGHRESGLHERSREDPTARFILELLRRCTVYQFHNTSETARIKSKWDPEDNHFLKEDGGNLAPVLLKIRTNRPNHYDRIIGVLRQIAPFFDAFVLEPTDGQLLLQWRERGSDLVFGAHQSSDGFLRAMALVTLLLQPEEYLPNLLILDEPELGLHPYAIVIVAGLLKGVSKERQVILATQSASFVDQFSPEDIVVVSRDQMGASGLSESRFHRLESGKLRDWLDEYSISELWEKNVIGGVPS